MTLRLLSGVAAAALMIVVALMLLWPARTFAATCGLASYYGTESGSRTANGEFFDGSGMTAASRGLPFGAKLRITYRGRSVIVRVNDRGPALRTGRFLDLSKESARRLGMLQVGVARVCAEVLN